MTNYVRYTLVYNPRNRSNKNGRARVYVCAYLHGEGRQYFYTGIDAEPSEWDEKRRLFHSRNPYGSYKNAECADVVRRLTDIEMGLRLRGERVSLRAIRQEFNCGGTADFHSFVSSNLLGESGCSFGTLSGRRSVHRALKGFRPELPFGQLTPALLKQFEQHLYRKGMRPASVSEYLTILRVFVRAAIRMGYMKAEENPFLHYNIRKVRPSRQGIPEETLAGLEGMKFGESERNLQCARDMFLFSCYTGLRFSDIVRLTTADILQQEGRRYLQIRTQKTGQEVSVPLDGLFGGKAAALIERYKGGERCFPASANNRTNERLAEIGRRLDPPRKFTFHQARHTFACMLASRGANPYTIKYLMGHASIQTSMIYIHTSLAMVEQDLSRISGM